MQIAGEIVVDADKNPIDEELLVNGKKEEKVKNEAKKEKGKTIIKGLRFKNVRVTYLDEIGAKKVESITLETPAVEKDWEMAAVRKTLNLYFDEQNIDPKILRVGLPSSGGELFDMEAPFLDKPIGQFTKKDCVMAAIYKRCRTVTGALRGDTEELQRSLYLHLQNLNNLDHERMFAGEKLWIEKDFDPEYKLS